MKSFGQPHACPRCQYPRMKAWDELTDDELFLAERLSASSEFTQAERRRHRFCPRCWLEEPQGQINA